ncbi:DNA-directed RNA polymerase subunit D [Methanofollis formosanus]|uniref:DNA-directed RNA polymerase subunit Rpo3 n=1 Tax=Methanofollis formosanus TaxID=299308 RepID=A0A8G1A1Z6_9EURY|nr:DNA-directed RNA polymerase subunit D [Methanofollis formosanus]QYZ79702.1 DNA-directed RNA polymerase subunit D [Methanofollis formosanus]
MQIEFARIDDDAARFVLSDATPAFANALRRAMIGEVPTLAIEDIRIYDNSSVLFDEILAHRLGLIPIKTDLSRFVLQSECSCGGEGCPLCMVNFTMSVEGPRTVLSSDLISDDPDTKLVHDDIPIVKLFEGQKVVLEARAVLGIGKHHAKWQPTNACGYKEYPVITVSENCDGCGMCIDECPRGVLELKGRTMGVVEGKLEECSLCRLCEKACLTTGIGEEPAVTVTADSSRFIFVVESDGSIPVLTIIEKGLEFIRNQSTDLSDTLSEIAGVN